MMNQASIKKSTAADTQTTTLFQRLGGFEAVNALVGAMYFQILRDPRVAHFFDHTNVATLLRHQRHFLTVAFGGKAGYSGRSLRDAHGDLVEKMGLNDSHFDAVAENVLTVMRDFGYGEGDMAEVSGILESVRNDVLGR